MYVEALGDIFKIHFLSDRSHVELKKKAVRRKIYRYRYTESLAAVALVSALKTPIDFLCHIARICQQRDAGVTLPP